VCGFPPSARHLKKSFSLFFGFGASSPTDTIAGVLMTLSGCLHCAFPFALQAGAHQALSHRRLASGPLPMILTSCT
jgi:hypothetical protein